MLKKYYWIFAGALVGLMSVVLGYVNFNLIVVDGTLSLVGSLAVIVEYVVVVYILSKFQSKIK